MLCGLMNRLQKLQQCLEIARKHNNSFMESNILLAIKEEQKNPSMTTYDEETPDE